MAGDGRDRAARRHGRKVVALTFDDGPGPFTCEVLATLAAKDVKATFFLIGADVAAHPDEARRIVAAGHQVGNHSWSHPRLVFKSRAFIASEIERTDRAIRDAGYRGAIAFRAPYGKKLIGLPLYLARHGRPNISWDVEPNSYDDIDRSATKITAHVVERVRPGSIILLHPMYHGRQATRAAIGPIVDSLRARGYALVTVDELLAMR